MASGGWFFLIFLALLILGVVGWIVFTRVRAQRQGLPPPSLSSYNPFANRHRSSGTSSTRSGGVIGWAKSKFDSLKGGGGGAYGPAGGPRRGLDPDGAWDTRVGDEADAYGHGGYYEEQELGLHSSSGGGDSYAGGGYGPQHSRALPEYGAEEMERGRSRSRDDGFIGGGQKGLDERYDQEMGRQVKQAQNPFGDQAERSELRGVSPRSVELDGTSHVGGKGGGGHGDSPTERRSMFRENM
ncbi:hypothetical protein G7Y79_00029g063160 [Physcia stellaris]|nr:hypothetical protein G7Y79_00029g063160 [Physcia stellaris]